MENPGAGKISLAEESTPKINMEVGLAGCFGLWVSCGKPKEAEGSSGVTETTVLSPLHGQAGVSF